MLTSFGILGNQVGERVIGPSSGAQAWKDAIVSQACMLLLDSSANALALPRRVESLGELTSLLAGLGALQEPLPQAVCAAVCTQV